MIKTNPRILSLDTECFHMNWDAGVAVLFCMSYKWMDDPKVHTLSVWDLPGKDQLDDSRLCKEIAKVIEEADMLITYNGIRFDIPFIQTRMLANELPILSPKPHKDLYYTAKFKLKLNRYSLFAVQSFLRLNAAKTPVDLRQWLKALIGDKKAQKEIIVHCENDVKVLEEAYLKLRPLMLAHPTVYGKEVCNKCGSNHLQKRGIYITTGRTNKQRFQCQKCGGWTTATITKNS